MYSTNIEDNRYYANCIAVADEIAVEKFIVDTGAKFSCCHYGVIDETLTEGSFKSKDAICIGGFVKGDAVRFYKYQLKQFTIGNLDMGTQHIWITFDERVTDIILGMDILKQVILITNPYDQKIYFCKDSDDYHQYFRFMVN